MADKGEQALVPRPLKGTGVLIKGDQVLTPPLPAGHGSKNPQHVQLVVQPPEETVHTHILCQAAQILQPGQKRPAGRVLRRLQGLAEIPLRVAAPDERQLVRGESNQG